MALLVNDILEQLAGGARREDEDEEENIEEEEVLRQKLQNPSVFPSPKKIIAEKRRAHTHVHIHTLMCRFSQGRIHRFPVFFLCKCPFFIELDIP